MRLKWMVVSVVVGACVVLAFDGAESCASEANDLVQLMNQANSLRTAGRSREALPIADRLAAQADAVFGDNAYNLALAFETAGLIYKEQALYAKAEPLLKRSLVINEKALGADDPYVPLSQSMLAGLYMKQARYAEAESLYLRSLAIREKVLGKDHLRVGESLINLATAYENQARYSEAESAYQRALVICEKSLGKEHATVADCLNNLGGLRLAQGQYAEAAQFYQRSLSIRENLLGKERPEVAMSLHNLASAYRVQCRYAEAEPLYQRALRILEQAQGRDHPNVALVLNNLSSVYLSQGRSAEVLSMRQRALAIREKALGAEHPLVASSLNDLVQGLIFYKRNAEAEPLLRRAVTIWEKSQGSESPTVAYGVDNLARVMSALDRYPEAELLFQRALAIREKAGGKEHPLVADTLCNLAEMYEKQGELTKAEPVVERTVAIWDKAQVGPLDRYRGYELRARVRRKLKKTEPALADLQHAIDLAEQGRGQSSGGETGRAELFSGYSAAFESMVEWQHQLGHPEEVFKTVERSRARSLVDQLATANIDLLAGVPAEEAAGLRQRQQLATSSLAQLEKQVELVRADKNLSDEQRERRLKELEERLRAARDEAVNAYLAVRTASPVYRQMVGKEFQPASLAETQSRLVGADGLLLEYFLESKGGYVIVIPPSGGKVRVDPLNVTKEQAARLAIEPGPLTEERMRKILANESGTGLLQQLRDASKAEATTDRLAALWQVLVPEPERALLADGKLNRCIVIPDAALAAFPFDTLVVETGEKPKYLLDVGPPTVTAPSATLFMNLSDLKSGGEEDSEKKSALLSVADPTYGVASTDSVSTVGELSARSRYGALHGDLRALPYTGWECNWVAESFRKAGFDAGVLQKGSAREISVRKYAPGRKYLHFACHGLVDQSYGNLFGALALTPGPAGSVDSADDGFLTLAEIYELNLRETELSILSACDTNYGPNQKGEGVWSLSRGFLVAGSKRVVASNWLVDDEAGASLVSVFCGTIAAEKEGEPLDYARGLQAAKRWVREQEKWQSPYYWGTFVLVGPH